MKRKSNFRPADSAEPADAVVRRSMRIVSFDAGTAWLLGHQRVTIVAALNANRVLIQYDADGRTGIADVSALRPWAPPVAENTLRTVPISEHSDLVWERAQEEHRLISALVGAGQANPKARHEVATLLGISDRQLRRKINRFQEYASPAAFLPQRHGPSIGSTYLNPKLESLIRDEVLRALKNSPDVAVNDLYPMLVSAAKGLNLKPPGRGTVNARLRQARAQPENLPAAIGTELAYRRAPVKSSIQSDGALSVVEMDHTVCDVHIVDAQYGYPIGRPVLSMMIDRMTRVILGMLLSLEAPSRLSVGLCLHHAVFPKQPWLKDLGLPEACWPGFGLPSTLYTDNAKEFTALSLKRAAELSTITLALRPLGCPAAGGIIERAIGTLMTKVRLLPGTSYSKLLGQAPRHAARHARFTLDDLAQYIARTVSSYHKNRHEGLGMPPLTAWESAWMSNGVATLPRIPDSSDTFKLTFLPGEWRSVTREGISLNALRYQTPSLYPLVRTGRKFMVRFDPRNLSHVFVETSDGHIRVPLRDSPLPTFSLWEWRESTRVSVKRGAHGTLNESPPSCAPIAI